MNAVTIQIELPPESKALKTKFVTLPSEFPQAIARGMTRALNVVKGRIISKRLIGRGPFPPSEHRLGQRTGQLAQSVRVEPAVVQGDEITGAIGSPLIYARVHEFGATITPQSKKFLVFNIGQKKVFARKVTIPERAPFRTEILENAEYIQSEIAKEIEASLPK
jgi:phage gpG-like protein